MLPFSLFSPFSGCGSPHSPPFFFFCFSFSCLLFFGCRPSCEGRFLFFLSSQKKRKKADVLLSFCPSFLRKGEEKTSVQGREKSVTDDIPETLFFFVFCFFSLIFAFLLAPFPDGFLEEGNPSSLLRSSSAFLFLEKKEKEEERNASNEEEFRIQERKREGKRDGCSRYPFSAPPGRQNFACDSDFRQPYCLISP